ncbi:MAG: hypothetical protein WKF48_11075 [Solirubrobacteraceae bacterium]
MSASARGTATDYSKGQSAPRAHSRRPRLALAAVALAGALLLILAELSPLYSVVVGSLQTPRRSVSTGANHGYALTPLAAVAVTMAVAWLRGAKVAGPMLGLLGLTALVNALTVDLPDTRSSGRLPESLAYSEARAKAGRGLVLELAGGAVLVLSGLGMLAFARADRLRRDRRISPTAPSSRRGAPPG